MMPCAMRWQTSFITPGVRHYIVIVNNFLLVSKLLTILGLHHIFAILIVLRLLYMCLTFLPCYVHIISLSTILTMLSLYHIFATLTMLRLLYMCPIFLSCYVYIISLSNILTMLRPHHTFVYHSYHVRSTSYLCYSYRVTSALYVSNILIMLCLHHILSKILTMLRPLHTFVYYSYHVISTPYLCYLCLPFLPCYICFISQSLSS